MKKKSSGVPSEPTGNSEALMLPIPPLAPSLLHQSVRRHRGNPDRGYDDREAIEAMRTAWQKYRQLRDLTFWELREHLARGLQDLSILPEETRKQILDLCQHVPNDPLFWRVLNNVEKAELLMKMVDEK